MQNLGQKIQDFKSDLSGSQKDELDAILKAYEDKIDTLMEQLKEGRINNMTTY